MGIKNTFEKLSNKIHDWESLHVQVKEWKSKGLKIVFTNGCFDILHYGHIHYLAAASDLADKLVIGVNSTASVKRLKGVHRPIHDDHTRKFQLAAMGFVNAITIFEQDTPYELIQRIQPDILVKGGDWLPPQIVGSDIVLAKGGKVLSLPFIEGYSTTSIEQKIKQS